LFGEKENAVLSLESPRHCANRQVNRYLESALDVLAGGDCAAVKADRAFGNREPDRKPRRRRV
jgi:hypothetical protein